MPPLTPRIAFLLVVAALGSISGSARAVERKGVRLAWARASNAEGCVGPIGLQEDVKGRLGYDPFTLAPSLFIEGIVERTAPTGHRAELRVRDDRGALVGKRNLVAVGSDCRALGEAVAIAITVAIDPDSTGARAAPPSDVREDTAPPPPPQRADVGKGPADGWKGRITLSGGAVLGLVPGASLVTSLRAHVRRGAWEGGIGAHVVPEAREGDLGFGLTTGSLDACVVPLRARWALGLCASAEVGLFHFFLHGRRLAPLDVGDFVWMGVNGTARLSVRLAGPVLASLEVGAAIPVLRTTANIRSVAEPVWKQSLVAGRGDLGVGIEF